MAKNLTHLLLIFGVSLFSCLILTPVVRAMARRCGLVDHPDGRRKVHAQVTALGGGLAIFGSTMLGVSYALTVSPLHEWLVRGTFWLSGLFAAASLICLVGLVDDFCHLRGKYKLLGQIVAVAIVIGCGVRVSSIQFFEWRWELGPLAIPFTTFLLIGAINSLNLIDGMDGLLSSVGLIICLAMGSMAFLTGSWAAACIAMALAGAMLGFLRYNFPPASIFMGDCGSMLVGLVVGVLAIQGSLKGPATAALAAPLAVLTIPIFDTLAAIVRRKLTGRSVYATDRGHMHHCMLRRGLTAMHVLTWVSGLSLVTLVGALATVALRNELFAILSALTVICVLIATRLFGFAEFLLVKDHLSASAGALFRGTRDRKPQEVEFHLQGTADWRRLWRELVSSADDQNLGSLCLDINAPAIQELYHARWTRDKADVSDFDIWRADLPVIINGHTVGRLEIAGRQDLESMSMTISRLATIVDNCELEVFATANHKPAVALVTASAGAGQFKRATLDSHRGHLPASESHGAELTHIPRKPR